MFICFAYMTIIDYAWFCSCNPRESLAFPNTAPATHLPPPLLEVDTTLASSILSWPPEIWQNWPRKIGRKEVKCEMLNWLVVYPPLWKIWKSVGMMTFPISAKIKSMFQSPPTRQVFFGQQPAAHVYTNNSWSLEIHARGSSLDDCPWWSFGRPPYPRCPARWRSLPQCPPWNSSAPGIFPVGVHHLGKMLWIQ